MTRVSVVPIVPNQVKFKTVTLAETNVQIQAKLLIMVFVLKVVVLAYSTTLETVQQFAMKATSLIMESAKKNVKD